MCFSFVLDYVLCVFGMFLGVCGSVGGVVLVHSRLLYVFDREDDVCLIRGHEGGWRGVGWCIVCEGVRCFQRRGLCVVGSRGIVSFVLLSLLLFVVCFCHGFGDGFHCVRYCCGIGLVSSWWHDK